MIYFHNVHRPDKPGVVMHIIMKCLGNHYTDIIMSAMASQITSVSIVCSTVGPGADQRKHQSSVSLTFAWGIQWWVPRTKGQKRGKCFHWMTSSWFPAYGLLNGIVRFTESITLVSRATGNSTDCSAVPSGKQVRRQLVHITCPLGGESTNH